MAEENEEEDEGEEKWEIQGSAIAAIQRWSGGENGIGFVPR